MGRRRTFSHYRIIGFLSRQYLIIVIPHYHIIVFLYLKTILTPRIHDSCSVTEKAAGQHTIHRLTMVFWFWPQLGGYTVCYEGQSQASPKGLYRRVGFLGSVGPGSRREIDFQYSFPSIYCFKQVKIANHNKNVIILARSLPQ